MEVKEWEYENFPEFDETVEGAINLETSGNEKGVRYIHNVEYAVMDGIPLTLQLLIPFTRNDPKLIFPCVVFVQGSAWMKQDVYAQLPLIAKLSEKGYVTAVVEYRHSGIAGFPAQAVDTRNAIRFLRIHAEEYGIDPKRIIVAGDSSGGHTAMFAGLRHNDDSNENLFPGVSGEILGIINYYGSVSVMLEDGNPTTLNHHLPDSPEGMEMGGVNLKEHPELCMQLSVECNIGRDTKIPPVLIFHGTKDRTVNTKQSVNLYRKMKECGKDVQLYLITGGDHGGAEFWTDAVLEIADTFIQRCFEK